MFTTKTKQKEERHKAKREKKRKEKEDALKPTKRTICVIISMRFRFIILIYKRMNKKETKGVAASVNVIRKKNQLENGINYEQFLFFFSLM